MARTNENVRYKGVFATGVALAAAIPVANPGDFAFVTGTGTIWSWTSSWADTTGIGAPGGADKQVQFNDGGDFGGNAGLTFNKGTATLTATHVSGTDIVEGQFNSNSSQSTVNGSTSGDFVWSMPFQGSSYKKLVIYLNALNDAGAAITYPTAFTQTPFIYGDAAVIALLSSNTTTLTIGASSGETGFAFVEGY